MQVMNDYTGCRTCSFSAHTNRESWMLLVWDLAKGMHFCNCQQGQEQKKIAKMNILLLGDKYEPDF